MCKTGCGFFGNIAWQGYCSKCYKEYFLTKQHQQAAHHQHLATPTGSTKSHKYETFPKNVNVGSSFQSCFFFPRVSRSLSDAGTFFMKPEASSSTLPRHGFSRFEEKKRHNQEVKSTPVKSLFRKTSGRGSASSGGSGSPKNTRERTRALSPESHSAIQDLGQFLQSLPPTSAHQAYSYLKMQVEKLDRLVSSGVLSPMDMSDRVHSTYQNFDDKLKSHSSFSELSSHLVEPLLDHSERYLTRLLYKKLFCPQNCDDEERDLAVQKRIRSLNWISAPLLDCRINELDPKVRDILEKAITHLIEMDGQRAPQDKLSSIISCSKLVFEMLGLSDQSKDAAAEPSSQDGDENEAEQPQPVSADDFLPALIYVVLRANPPRIHSNLNFITRFAAPGRLMQGEGGYYFTNLCCAVSFLENLTSDSLALSAEEFDRYMSGKSIPFTSLQAGVMVSEGLRLMYQNMSTLSELKHKQQLIQQQISDLKCEMDVFNFSWWKKQESIEKEVADGLERFPIQIRGKRAPIKPDEEQPDESDALKLLPPPLLPHKVGDQQPPPVALPNGDEACADDPFASLSLLTVQGRVIPCIPCDNKSPSGPAPSH
uniref:EOG090X03G5 n=1 Tax=Alona affinis TaxID=381656 RepID=A0A9N6ZED6_9CRUS|nr:EOG090X03G5 [Alona affinis]